MSNTLSEKKCICDLKEKYSDVRCLVHPSVSEQKKFNDLKPFKHGQEGTHYACPEMMRMLGGKVSCCGCNHHDCKPRKEENEATVKPQPSIMSSDDSQLSDKLSSEPLQECICCKNGHKFIPTGKKEIFCDKCLEKHTLPSDFSLQDKEGEDWEKEFDYKFVEHDRIYTSLNGKDITAIEIKAFMRKEKQRTVSQIREQIVQFAIENKDVPDEMKGLMLYTKIMEYLKNK